jgi:hypothetical protein
MKTDQKLISALRAIAKKVIDPNSEWCYEKVYRCHCGLLVKELAQDTLTESDIVFVGPWTQEAEIIREEGNVEVCKETGLPLTSVFQVLASYGITFEELYELEMVGRKVYYGDYGLTSLTNLDDEEYRQVVSDYLIQKAEELEKRS